MEASGLVIPGKKLFSYFVRKFLVDRRDDESEQAPYAHDPHRMKTSQSVFVEHHIKMLLGNRLFSLPFLTSSFTQVF